MATKSDAAAWYERMEREHAAYLERIRTGDLATVVATLREWSEVEPVPAQDEFDLILARLEALITGDRDGRRTRSARAGRLRPGASG